ncbi:MAG TPA: hypothetical protein PK122_02460 [Candidatus Paceibacterota bacterium]|nr:hypothetical protein [Candidatus Paceibacterota bacterium]
MQRRQRIVFGNMGGFPHEEKIPISREEANYNFNTLVFEIYASWEFVVDMMKRAYSGALKQVDSLERDWLNFIIENSININDYQDSDSFIEAWFKK